MFLLAIVIVLISILVLFYISVKWDSNYWKKQNVPSEDGVFFYGNFKDAFDGKEHFGLTYKRYYDQYVHSSPFVGLFKSRSPLLLINDLDLAKNVLVGNFASFCDTELQADAKTDPIWASNPIAVKGDAWKTSRNRWISHLSPIKIKQSYECIIKSSQDLVDYITAENKLRPNDPIELLNVVQTFFMDYLIAGIFGITINSFQDPKNLFNQIKNTLLESSFVNGLISNIFVVAPFLQAVIPFRFVSKENENRLLTIARDIMKHRQETGKPDSDIYDYLQKYAQADKKSSYSDWDLAARIFGVILDGSETSSHPACFALYEVACNSDVQKRLRQEIEEAYQKENGVLSYEELLRLPYLEMVSAESLRLYTAITHLTRVCTKDITLHSHSSSVMVKKGIPVIIPVYAFHHDPQYYPDPYKFDPERFASDVKEHRPKLAYMPFGEGPRICAGMRVGTLEMKVLLSLLLHRFDLTPGQVLPRPLELEPNFFVGRSKDKLSIRFKPIQQHN